MVITTVIAGIMVEVSVEVVGTAQVGDRNTTGSVSVCVGAGADLRGYIFRVGVGMVDLGRDLGMGMGLGVGVGVWDL